VAAQLVSDVHEVGQVVSAPSHTYGAQDGDPAPPDGSSVQVPLAVAPRACVHTLQPPVQAVLQHTPSEQKPVRH
jgi:hypothetical protein